MVKPIETRYKGYRFRSRLEARWAVFFDVLRVSYQYEPEGFELIDKGRGWERIFYLPDFLIFGPKGEPDFWVEVKPFMPPLEEFQKLALLCQHDWMDGLLLVGEPHPFSFFLTVQNRFLRRNKLFGPFDPNMGLGLHKELQFYLHSSFLKEAEARIELDREGRNIGDNAYFEIIDDAFQTARSARFEHGERGI